MPNPPAADPPAGDCGSPSPPLLLAGIAQFNARQFYQCHETLELVWRPAQGTLRDLCHGELQVAVGCLHAERGNQRRAQALLGRGAGRLQRLPATCHGVRVDRLLAATERFAAAVSAGRAAQEPYPQVELS